MSTSVIIPVQYVPLSANLQLEAMRFLVWFVMHQTVK